MGYPSGGSVFLGGDGAFSNRPFAENTQAAIDTEVRRIVTEAEQRSVSLFEQRRDVLDKLVQLLLEKETIDGAEGSYALAGRTEPSRSAGLVTSPDVAVAVHAEPASLEGNGPGN